MALREHRKECKHSLRVEKAARKSNGRKWLRGAVLLIPVSVLAGYPAPTGSNHQSYTLFFLFSTHLLSP